MSIFIISSWLITILTGIGLYWIAHVRPSVLVKPSYFAIFSLYLNTQVGSAYAGGQIENSLVSPWDYFFVVQVFPLLALPGCLLFFNGEATEILHKVRSYKVDSQPDVNKVMIALAVLVGLIATWYFSVVPFDRTGLYAILFAPKLATMARENSFKLLDSAWLKYSYSIMALAIIPMLSVLLITKMVEEFRTRYYFWALSRLVAVALLLFASSVSGARGISVLVLGAIFYALYVRTKIRFSPPKMVVLALLIFLIPTFLTILREGKSVTFANTAEYFALTLDRLFYGGMEAGVWNVDYVQTHGFFGLAGITNLANFLGMRGENIFNVVGLFYTHGVLQTISANTSFTIAYYACFGISSILFCLPMLWLLDAVLLAQNRISPGLLLAGIAASQMAVSNLSSTFFTTMLLTCGFIPITAVALLLTLWFPAQRVRRSATAGRELLKVNWS